jgi:crotonobetainyl-CoA:carnitine CoA-transferase CaiB-like acyl-CoA transferase
VGDGVDRESTYFLSANRNKESIALDLRSPYGREVLLDMVRRAALSVKSSETQGVEFIRIGLLGVG